MDANSSYPNFGRHEFITSQPGLAIPVLIVLGLAAIAGTSGNILILISVATTKSLHNVESIFIVSMACSDLYVTTVSDTMSIIAKVEGPKFFDHVPGLCQTIGSLCTIACVISLLNIATMSCHRYIFIIHNRYYRTIFNTRNSITMCIGFCCIGIFTVLLNLAGIGDHSYDHKSIECTWDRMSNVFFNITFSVVMVWIPLIIVGASYLHIYLHVNAVRGRVHNAGDTKQKGSNKDPSYKLARTFFLIYCVFSTCWLPYSMLMAFNADHNVSHEVFVVFVSLAHIHPSLNWLVYFFTNRKFHDAFISILHINRCFSKTSQLKTHLDTNEGGERGFGDETAISIVSSREIQTV